MKTIRMLRSPMLAIAMAILSFSTPPVVAADEEKFVFETWDGHKIEAFKGSFTVPENREAKDSRMIPVKYVRLPATGESVGPPIVYLAGGPGGSGIMAINYRYRMFMAMRKHGDVIALDQRGTGGSNTIPGCQSSQIVPVTTRISDEAYIAHYRKAVKECLAFWEDQGVDIAGYNTIQSALDLDALRQHLGAEKIVLWGTSYGSHLALAALKVMEDKIDKVVLSSVEGLNQTIKLPSRTGAYFDRLQAAVNTQPNAKAIYPDIKGLMHRVHAKLEENPVLLQLKLRGRPETEYLLQRRDMQQLASSFISDPQTAAILLDIYLTLDQGGKPSFENIPTRFFPDGFVNPGKPISLSGMSIGMDMASGMTAERKAKVAKQAKTALLKDYLNFSYHFDGIAPELDLGDDFRTGPVSSVPVLLLSGTLDGRTYIEGQREAVSGLADLTAVTVINAGHNLFDIPSKDIQNTIDRFMQGKQLLNNTITVDLPEMAPQPDL